MRCPRKPGRRAPGEESCALTSPGAVWSEDRRVRETGRDAWRWDDGVVWSAMDVVRCHGGIGRSACREAWVDGVGEESERVRAWRASRGFVTAVVASPGALRFASTTTTGAMYTPPRRAQSRDT